jgi:hypothetical protein
MFAIVRDGAIIKLIRPHTAFELDGVEYNAKWTVRMTAEEKTALGITEVYSNPKPDERFYWVQENPIAMIDGLPRITFKAIAKDLDALKEQFIAQERDNANKLLTNSDWVVIRKIERNIDIPEDVAELRANTLLQFHEKETAITDASTVEELINIIAPNSQEPEPDIDTLEIVENINLSSNETIIVDENTEANTIEILDASGNVEDLGQGSISVDS